MINIMDYSTIIILPLFICISNIINSILSYFNVRRSLECANYICAISIQLLITLITLYDRSSIYPMYLLLYYFMWDLLYISYIEPKLYSRSLLYHHFIAIWIVLWSLNTFSHHTWIMNTGIMYLERPNMFSNLSLLIQKIDKFKITKTQLLILNIIYLGMFVYDRLYNFITHIYLTIIVDPKISTNTMLITICGTCILTFISIKLIIKQYYYLKKIYYQKLN
jgi:hypothetical protein